jgi:hypothetical protein
VERGKHRGINKRIRGDSNQQNEEFSHNRITVILGSSGVILAVFVCCLVLAAIVWMMHSQGSLLAFLIVASFLALFAGAGVVGAIFVLSFGIERLSDALRTLRVNRILSSTVVAGEVVSHYDGEEWTHLSAIHEQGKVPALPMKAQSLNTDESTILELFDKGMSLRAIEKQMKDAGVTYYQIQKVTSAHRK